MAPRCTPGILATSRPLVRTRVELDDRRATQTPPMPAPSHKTTRCSQSCDDYFDLGVIQQVGSDLTLGIDGYYKKAHNLLDEGQFGSALSIRRSTTSTAACTDSSSRLEQPPETRNTATHLN